MKFFLSVFFLFLSIVLLAQKVTVFDIQTGKVIHDVTLYNKSKSKTAVTNDMGVVDISEFSKNETIYFYHLSYASYTQTKQNIQRNSNQVFLSRESEQLDEVVLSIFKKGAKSKRIAKQTAIITKKEIAHFSPQTSADLLSNITGIKVQKSQFGGGSPVLRGMESNRVLLVVDGVRLNNAIYRKGHLQNSITVSPNILDRVEVVLGPTSVTYGSDALGGVIHYYTRKPKLSNTFKIKPNLFSRYSSVNQEFTNTASVELQNKKWASFTSFSRSTFQDLKMGKKRSHGFENWGKVFYYSDNSNTSFNPDPTKNDNVNLQRNTGYDQMDFLQKFFVPITENTDFTLNFQYSTSSDIPRFDKLSELKNGSLKFAQWYYTPQKRLLLSPQLTINPNKKWLKEGVITLAYQNISEGRVQRKFGSLQQANRKENVFVYSLTGDFSVPIVSNKNLSYGFDVNYNKVRSSSEGKLLKIEDNKRINSSSNFYVPTRYPDGGSSYLSSAVFFDFRQNITKNAVLNTGIRITNTQLFSKWKNQSLVQLPSTEIALQNTALTASIGYVYKPKVHWQVNAVLSSGFRAPNVDDVGKVREKKGKLSVPNIHLKPEHAYNAEIGLQRYFNKRKFKVQFNAYYTLLHNYIYRDNFELAGKNTIVYDNEDVGLVANINRKNAYITGFTASYLGKLFRKWRTSGFITYTKGETYDTKEPMSSIPPLFGRFKISYRHNKLVAGANLNFNAYKSTRNYNISEGIDNIEQTPLINPDASQIIDKYYGSPSWATIGFNLRYNFSSYLTMQLQLNNFFDEHYKEFASGISAPGRNFSITLQSNF